MKKILGIPATAFIIGLIVVAGASAALVKFLSNSKTVEFDVDSPLVMKFDGEDYTDTATEVLGVVYGGDTIVYKLWTKNLASVNVPSYPVTVIKSLAGNKWTGVEVTQVILKDPNYPAGIDVTSLLYYVKGDGTLAPFSAIGTEDTDTVKLFMDNNGDGIAQKYDRIPPFEEWNTIEITTNAAIMPGIYQIKSCQLYDLTGDCN